jgi:hypothetical protein
MSRAISPPGPRLSTATARRSMRGACGGSSRKPTPRTSRRWSCSSSSVTCPDFDCDPSRSFRGTLRTLTAHSWSDFIGDLVRGVRGSARAAERTSMCRRARLVVVLWVAWLPLAGAGTAADDLGPRVPRVRRPAGRSRPGRALPDVRRVRRPRPTLRDRVIGAGPLRRDLRRDPQLSGSTPGGPGRRWMLRGLSGRLLHRIGARRTKQNSDVALAPVGVPIVE